MGNLKVEIQINTIFLVKQEMTDKETYEHLEWIEREGDSTDGRGQVGLHVRILAALANFSFLGDVGWHDAQVDADLDGLAILVGRQAETVVIAELERGARRHLLFEEGVVVGLVQDDLLLCETHVLEQSLQVERPLADVVVRLEQVEVPSLHDEHHWIGVGRLDIE